MCAYNSRSPGSSWIAIVPESGATPEIFRSIEPRALITRRFVRERLQGFSRQRWQEREGQRKGKRGGVEISRCFDRDLSGCFGCNHPGAVTTIIFGGRHAGCLGGTNFDATLPLCGYLAARNGTLQRIRNRQLRSFDIGQFIQFDGPAKPVIPDIFRDLETARENWNSSNIG